VLDIPPAGAVAALPPSMLTWHFALEGAVVEMEDEEPEQAATNAAIVQRANCRTRTVARNRAITLPKKSCLQQSACSVFCQWRGC
jgi:hypothetical protein